MNETSNKNSTRKQRSDTYHDLLIGIAICLSWFALALVSDISLTENAD